MRLILALMELLAGLLILDFIIPYGVLLFAELWRLVY